MLEGIETGYEEKFDFPRWNGRPKFPWLLATVPRTGSTYVSHVLWASGCLGAPLEYLNFDPNGPSGHAAAVPAEQNRIWSEVLARRTSPNGVFGLKAFPLLMEDLHRANPPLLTEVMKMMIPGPDQARVVQLRRRDRQAHAVSYARALLSGVWRKEQEREGQMPPDFSREAFDVACRLIDSQEQAWTEMYAGLRVKPLILWYEDVLEKPDEAVVQVADYIGVTLVSGARVAVPAIERQSQSGTSLWFAALGGQGD
ncbi:hypothetical protein GRI89_04820 [Altererythrobacter salegens]|uniref:Sulphotransferase Stf0 domain-containing protein n=1 Tax=Croceibacterium salegens TaxID=1737568 RepID=A0A6I4SWX5_9SPHN|nr:Stf0 family sulfotransferase [Croceibacterium salegens]MXO58862.1 hypothetical protein [Croceibacterium salegens]